MKEFWNTVQALFTAVGGWLGWFLGGCDGLLYALIAFVVIDYITGVMCAITDHTLSSEVGFRGICRKVLIFLLVGIANILDVNVIGTGSVLRTAVIFFYISNEGVSLLENAGHLGLPVRRHIVGGENRTLISVETPLRLCRTGTCRKLSAERPQIVVALFERQLVLLLK